MYSLGVSRSFSARHYLVGGDWGDENVEHSHRYRIELVLEARELDCNGFLLDIVEVEQHLEAVTGKLRDRTLNELDGFKDRNPSIEQLATVIHDDFRTRLAHLALAGLAVTVWEDDIAWTSYRLAL